MHVKLNRTLAASVVVCEGCAGRTIHHWTLSTVITVRQLTTETPGAYCPPLFPHRLVWRRDVGVKVHCAIVIAPLL